MIHQDSGMELSCWSYGWKTQTLTIPVKYQMEFIMKNCSIIFSSKRYPQIISLYNQNIQIPQHVITAMLITRTTHFHPTTVTAAK
jgi:hypothetical protein